MDKLIECPACKGEGELIIVGNSFEGAGYSYGRCKKCGLQTRSSKLPRCPTPSMPDRKEAEELHDMDSIRIWNTRLTSPKTA